MRKFINKLIYFFCVLSFAGVFLYFSQDLQIDAAKWLSQSHPYVKMDKIRYETFSKGEPFLISISLEESFFREEVLNRLLKLSDSIKKINNVVSVKTPLEVSTIIQKNGQIHSITFQEGLNNNIFTSIEEYRNYFLESKYYGRLLSKDEKGFVILIHLDIPFFGGFDSIRKRNQFVKEIRSLLQKDSYFNDYTFAGDVFLMRELNENINQDLKKILPISISILFFILFFIFRNFFLALSVSLTSALCMLFTFMILSLFDIPFTSVTTILIVLILVISVTDSIHILMRWQSLSSSKKWGSLKQTLKDTWFPCLFTSVTTSIGFASFLLSDLVSLYYLGLSSLIAISFSYFIIMITNWAFLYCFPLSVSLKKDSFREKQKLSSLVEYLYLIGVKYRRMILFFVVLIPLSLIILLPFFKVDTSFLNTFFKGGSQIRKNFLVVDEKFGGIGIFDILLIHDEEDYFHEVRHIDKIDELSNKIKELENVLSVDSYLEPVSLIHRELQSSTAPNTEYPQEQEMLDQELLLLEFSRTEEKKDILSPYIDFSYQKMRIRVNTPNLSSLNTKVLETQIRRVVKEVGFSDDVEIQLLGVNMYTNVLTDLMINTQFVIIFFVVSLISIIFIISFGFRLGFIAILTNLLPMFLSTIIMIIFQFSFDFSTILINSIAFSICVDDTIHCLYYYRMNNYTQDIEIRLKQMLQSLIAPLTYTSILFTFSFFVFSFSIIAMIFKFGIFCVLAIIFAYFSNMIVLPVLIRTFGKKQVVG